MITMKRLITIALAIVMIFALGVTVFADSSPVPKEQYSIVVTYSPSDGSLGDASADKNTVIIDPSDDGLVTLTANVKDGKFSKWDIKGEYDIVEGNLTTPKLVIRPHSDIIANAIFEKDGKPATPDTPSSSSGGSGTSPKTGDPLYMIIVFSILALGMGAFAVKKIKE